MFAQNTTRNALVTRLASLEIHKDELTFCAGHFTIFSATEREHMHGHNYCVSVLFDIKITHNGLSFDYRHFKRKLIRLCEQLNTRFLLPTQSPYLSIKEENDYLIAHFNQKKLPFLKEDVVLLPLTNITIEELSYWFLQKILEEQSELDQLAVKAITVKVYNGPGQSGGACWQMQ